LLQRFVLPEAVEGSQMTAVAEGGKPGNAHIDAY
jgi:hypothetical protein